MPCHHLFLTQQDILVCEQVMLLLLNDFIFVFISTEIWTRTGMEHRLILYWIMCKCASAMHSMHISRMYANLMNHSCSSLSVTFHAQRTGYVTVWFMNLFEYGWLWKVRCKPFSTCLMLVLKAEQSNVMNTWDTGVYCKMK